MWVVWGLDLARGVNTRLTFESGGAGNGTWSPDGSQIVYAPGGGQSSDLYRKPANGAGQGELLFHSVDAKAPLDWSRDGRFLLFMQRGKDSSADLWVLPMEGAEHKPFPYLATPFDEMQGKFSPDGHWVVYASNETGTAGGVCAAVSAVDGREMADIEWRGRAAALEPRRQGVVLFHARQDADGGERKHKRRHIPARRFQAAFPRRDYGRHGRRTKPGVALGCHARWQTFS